MARCASSRTGASLAGSELAAEEIFIDTQTDLSRRRVQMEAADDVFVQTEDGLLSLYDVRIRGSELWLASQFGSLSARYVDAEAAASGDGNGAPR